MSWSHDVAIALSLLILLIGIALALPPRITRQLYISPTSRRRPRLAPATAHDLGRTHRLLARMLQSSHRPADENFVIAAQLWPYADSTPHLARAWDLTLPLLGLEDLLERLEALSARIAHIGRRRGGR